jgi:hypothetical protein
MYGVFYSDWNLGRIREKSGWQSTRRSVVLLSVIRKERRYYRLCVRALAYLLCRWRCNESLDQVHGMIRTARPLLLRKGGSSRLALEHVST